jgi:hypothetical protein
VGGVWHRRAPLEVPVSWHLRAPLQEGHTFHMGGVWKHIDRLDLLELVPAYVSTRQQTSAYVSIRQQTSAYVSIRQHTSAHVSTRQHTSAHVSIRRERGLLELVPPAASLCQYLYFSTSKAVSICTLVLVKLSELPYPPSRASSSMSRCCVAILQDT